VLAADLIESGRRSAKLYSFFDGLTHTGTLHIKSNSHGRTRKQRTHQGNSLYYFHHSDYEGMSFYLDNKERLVQTDNTNKSAYSQEYYERTICDFPSLELCTRELMEVMNEQSVHYWSETCSFFLRWSNQEKEGKETGNSVDCNDAEKGHEKDTSHSGWVLTSFHPMLMETWSGSRIEWFEEQTWSKHSWLLRDDHCETGVESSEPLA